VAALETAGAIGGIGGIAVMIVCLTAFSWNILVSAMIGLTIGFVLAFIGVIVVGERKGLKKSKKKSF
jgi:hypothetical protein